LTIVSLAIGDWRLLASGQNGDCPLVIVAFGQLAIADWRLAIGDWRLAIGD
jgi:hypothetical protein